MSKRTAFLLSGFTLIALALPGCGKSSSGPTATSQSTHTAPPGSTAQSTPASTPASLSPPTVTVAPTTPTALLVSGTANGVTATLHGSTHAPKVNQPWPLHFTVTHRGALAKAAVQYEYLFGGQVVARRSHYTFTGHFSDIFQWPATAVGYPLTFRAVIVSENATINLDYPVQVTG